MYLHTFTEIEKKAFWVLANSVIAADLVLSAEEEVLLVEYVREMAVERSILENTVLDAAAAMEVFSSSARSTQMSVFTELYALALCDNEYSIEEESFMGKLEKQLKIDANTADSIEECIKAINVAYAKLNSIIAG